MATRQEGSFVATDAAGNEYTVIIYRDLIDASNMHSRTRTQVPAKLGKLSTTDGRHVNYIDKGSYEIVGRPMIHITSDDANAP